MKKKHKLTNAEIFSLGEVIEDYPCDVEGTNASIEHIVEHKGKYYSIITDWDNNIRKPNNKANSIVYEPQNS